MKGKHNQTLCWRCANAVPDREGECGCTWSRSGVPVSGWEAVRRDIRLGVLAEGRKSESYRVVKCPRFVPDLQSRAEKLAGYRKRLGVLNVCRVLLEAALDTAVSEADFRGLLALVEREEKVK